MKKINQYILTHYPLIWNMRFHIFFPVVLLLNIIFYLAGYSTALSIAELSEFRLNSNASANIMAILVAIIVMIAWLVYYLRHNAFKSILPVSKSYLAKEFLCMLLIVFGLCCFITSHEKGEIDRIQRLAKEIDVQKESEIELLADHFLPYNQQNFTMLKNTSNDTSYEYTEPNYLNFNNWKYRGYYITNDSARLAKDSLLHLKAFSWLKENKRDSIKNVINQYLALCIKYGGRYRFNVDAHIASIYAKPGFWIERRMIETSQPDNATEEYITTGKVGYALNTIQSAHNGLDTDIWTIIYYFSIVIVVLLFSFRITNVKTWFIAIISWILLAIFVGLLGVVGLREEGICWFILILIFAALFVALTGISSKRNKQVTGVSYVLVIWSVPFFILLIYGILIMMFKPDYYVHSYNNNVRLEHPFYTHLKNNLRLYTYIGIGFTIAVMISAMIPLARKWQANPVE